jgi:hypothetical protein
MCTGGWGVKMTTNLHLVPTLRMSGAIPPVPQCSFMAWCSVKAQGQLYLYFTFIYKTHFTYTNIPSKLSHVIILAAAQEVPNSDLGPVTDNPNRFLWIYSFPATKYWDSTLT